jgi:hypothetical protein
MPRAAWQQKLEFGNAVHIKKFAAFDLDQE